MNPKLNEKLKKKFPELYEEIRYFECGDGWYNIIYELSEEITEADPQSIVKPIQVKEKFGTLRYYYNIDGTPINLNSNVFYDKIQKIIDKYLIRSTKTCEVCGLENETVHRRNPAGWVRTLCDSCAADDKRKKENPDY